MDNNENNDINYNNLASIRFVIDLTQDSNEYEDEWSEYDSESHEYNDFDASGFETWSTDESNDNGSSLASFIENDMDPDSDSEAIYDPINDLDDDMNTESDYSCDETDQDMEMC